jgi:hypothetical protein
MILKDKNNFPINLGDIIVIHQDSDLYGSLGIVFELTMIHNHHTIGIFIDNDELYLDKSIIEVIDNIEHSIFDGFDTSVSIPVHQGNLTETSTRCFKWKNLETKTFLKKFEKEHGYIPTPRRFSIITINWSERGRGFGEYLFWQNGDKIYCNNEDDNKETIKRVLCQMVDQAILNDPK